MGTIRGGMNGFLGTIGQPTAQVIDGSLKFAKSEYLTRTPSSAGNRSVYTGSVWVKRTEFAPENNSNSNAFSYTIFSAGTNTANNIDNIQFYKNAGDDSNKIAYESYPGSFQYNLMTTPTYRDPNGWYNVLWNYDGTTAKIYVNGEQVTSFDPNTQNGGSGGHFNNTVSHAIGHSPDAGYSKEYAGYMSQFYWIDGQVLGPEYFGFTDPLTNTWRPRKVKTSGPNDGRTWSSTATISSGGANGGNVLTNGFNGSTSGAFEGDTSGATVTVPISTNIIKGGVRVYAAVTSSNPLVVVIKNGDTTVETINAGSSGGKYYGSSSYSGPITSLVISRTGRAPEFNAISINGIILKDNSTTNFEFGTNGFYLPMDNQDDFEKDKSGNGNDFTKNNFNGTSINPDVVKDSPSGAVFGGRAQTGITTTSSAPANYCTFNPFDSNQTHSNGNLSVVCDGGTSPRAATGTISVSSGKYYHEVTLTAQSGQKGIIGYVEDKYDGNGSTIPNGSSNGVFYFGEAGNKIIDNTSTSYGASYTVNDVIGVALNLDDGDITFYKNGSSHGKITTKTFTGAYKLATGHGSSSGSTTYALNAGQKPFKYVPPQGFLPLNSATARPNTVVPRSDQYIGVVRYTGNAGSNNVTGYKFKPDFVWLKNRGGSGNHFLHDSVRGGTKAWYSDNTNKEYDYSPSGVTSFNSDGFTVNGEYGANYGSTSYVSWCWRAGGNKNTFNIDDVGYSSAAAAGLDGGTITPTGASVGTKQGFSIIGYNGTDNASDTFTHGLTQKPDLVIIRNRDTDGHDGVVYSSTIGATARVDINGNDGTSTNVAQFNNTEPTSSVFTIGTYDNVNKLNDKYICYLWHSVPGLQKFGGYTGNGSDDGPFIETGFRPALIWTRVYAGSNVTNNAGWFIYDTQDDTNPYNDDYGNDQPGNRIQYANLNNPINANDDMGIDILSNGFRLRADSSGYSNWSGRSYFYAAFAEAPASNLFGGQSNAR